MYWGATLWDDVHISAVPVSPDNWSSTASGEPYVGQTVNLVLTARVPEGTTVANATVSTLPASTAFISGSTLTIQLNSCHFESNIFEDVAFTADLKFGGMDFDFSETGTFVIWSAPSITVGTSAITNISSLANNDYIAIYRGSYYVYDNGSTDGNSVKQSILPNPVTSPYIWQIKDLSGSNLKLMNYGTGKYIEKRPNETTGQTTNTTSTSSDYATLTIAYTSSSWQFKLSDQELYFNNWSGSNANVGWWGSGADGDDGSKFQIHKCTVVPCTRPTE